MRRLIIPLLLLLVPLTASDTLRVALHLGEPFAVETEEGYSGFAVEYLEKAFDKTDIELSFLGFNKVESTLVAVKQGHSDFAIGSIPITKEIERQGIDFTMPYFNAGQGILVGAEETHAFVLFLYRNLVMLALTLVVGLVYWTETTEDKRRLNLLSKEQLTTLVGIFAVFALVYFFWSGMSAVLDTKAINRIPRIESTGELFGLRIAAVKETVGESMITAFSENTVLYDSVEEAVYALYTGEVHAVIHDWAQLSSRQDETKLLLPIRLKQHYYGLAFPDNSKLIEVFNLFQLDMLESGEYEKLYNKYF